MLSNDLIARALAAAPKCGTLTDIEHVVILNTSTLRFLETRFGAEAPNLSAWRRSVTGDLTSAFNFARVDASVPSLPQPSAVDNRITTSSCASQCTARLRHRRDDRA